MMMILIPTYPTTTHNLSSSRPRPRLGRVFVGALERAVGGVVGADDPVSAGGEEVRLS